jgi:transcriptional regulator NrdR family protein
MSEKSKRKRVFPKGKVRDAIRKAVEELDLGGGTSETIAEKIKAQGHKVPASVIESGLKDIGEEFYMYEEDVPFPKEKVWDAIRKVVEDLDLEGGTSETIAEKIEAQGHKVPASVIESGLEDIGEEFYMYEEDLKEESEKKYAYYEGRGW